MEENGGHNLFVLFIFNKLLICSCFVWSFIVNSTVQLYLIKYVIFHNFNFEENLCILWRKFCFLVGFCWLKTLDI